MPDMTQCPTPTEAAPLSNVKADTLDEHSAIANERRRHPRMFAYTK
jgi:hypothetical protein